MSTIKYDSGAAATFEGEVEAIAGRIETIIGDRDDQKKFVADNFENTDNDADYDAVEAKWLEAADAVRLLVVRARELMQENDVTASTAHNKACAADDRLTVGPSPPHSGEPVPSGPALRRLRPRCLCSECIASRSVRVFRHSR